MRLSELGEFEILKKVLIPRAAALGDLVGKDCAIVPVTDASHLVVTSDKGNRPLVWSLEDKEHNYEEMGWLTAAAGISDLATVGATALCATNNIIAPNDFDLALLDDFSKGFCGALSLYGFQHAGGDLSEGHKFSTSATFVGTLDGRQKRKGRPSASGYVVAIGELGTFAASYLKAKRLGYAALDAHQQRLLSQPEIPFRLMQKLIKNDLIVAATDASDGVHIATTILADRQQRSISIDISGLNFEPHVISEANLITCPPELLAFSWGNWQQIVLVDANDRNAFESALAGTTYHVLGEYREGSVEVKYSHNGFNLRPEFRNNEAFRRHSFVSANGFPFP